MENINLKQWMTNLPNFLKSTPIIDLAIPGSHNTFTYSLSRWSPASPDAPPTVRALSRFLRPFANPIIYNWSRTQNLNVQQQLEVGIRYLDVRLACRGKKFYVAHGLYGGKLQLFLKEINKFLSDNTEEVVVIDMQHFYKFSEDDHQQLIKMLETELGGKMLSTVSCDIANVCLNDFVRLKAQALIIYRQSAASSTEFLWQSSCWPTYWPDTYDIDDLIEKLDNALINRISSKGFVSQFILTVDVSYILKHFTRKLKNIVEHSKQYLESWVLCQTPGSHDVNVIICDFVDAEFTKSVIGLNFKK